MEKGNAKRSKWRSICRQKLSRHILDTLQIEIDPSDVRLIDDETPYQWEVYDKSLLPLFKKQMSKHSLGAYRQLCLGIGTQFRAIRKVNCQGESLREKIARLSQELDEAQCQIYVYRENESSMRSELERQLALLENAQETIDRQQQETQHWTDAAEAYYQKCSEYSTTFEQILTSLQCIHPTAK